MYTVLWKSVASPHFFTFFFQRTRISCEFFFKVVLSNSFYYLFFLGFGHWFFFSSKWIACCSLKPHQKRVSVEVWLWRKQSLNRKEKRLKYDRSRKRWIKDERNQVLWSDEFVVQVIVNLYGGVQNRGMTGSVHSHL